MGKKRTALAGALLASAIFMLVFPGVKKSPAGQGANPLKEEMLLLDAAFKNLVRAVVLNEPGTVEEDFEKVHGARERTEEALEKGKIKLPKNNENIAAFMEMDADFHEKVERLIGLAKKKDMDGVLDVTHEMLDACVSCHRDFRR